MSDVRSLSVLCSLTSVRDYGHSINQLLFETFDLVTGNW